MHSSPGYPDDADGDALRAVAASGSDMSRPMVIDFAIDASSRSMAEACRVALEDAGFNASLYQDDEDQRWSVYCPIRMIPEYDAIARTQKILGELVADIGGTPDGWGTFGNVEGA
ncbi:MAG: ribonuclease E inhibitor RraB [Hyphomonadaceae bacterium]|nr:ribonuclease E inhibitor RraB [Hyphomonadaceae bacterium]